MGNITVKGQVDAFLVSADGVRRQVVSGSNTLLYGCADAVARLFAGLVDFRPRTVAFVCAGTADQGANFHFTQGDRLTRKQAEIVGTGLSVHDEEIDGGHRFDATDSGYAGNRVTLRAMTTKNTEAEYVYGFILKDGPGPESHVLAVKRLEEPVRRADGYAMAVSWAVTFS